MNRTLLFIFTLTVLLAGCQSYAPDPIDWDAVTAPAPAASITLATPADAVTLALVGNREINLLRLKATSAEAVAQETGWWEDPELEFDLKRILGSSAHPFLGGAGLVFTIPLSGVREAQIKAAEAYTRATLAEIKAAEHALATQAQIAVVELAAAREQVAQLRAHLEDPRIHKAGENVARLYAAGEVDYAARTASQRARHLREHALLEAQHTARAAEIKVLQLLGLRPDTQIALGFTLESLGELASPEIDVRTLIRHPEVLSALAQVEEQEAALEIAIRQQYPDLKLGPVYANEEGLNRLGFTAGITLPLWNRNRQAIAEAKGAREEARQSAIDTWKNLVCEAATATHALATRLAHQPPHAGDVVVADQLLAAGELTSVDYLSFREETLDLALAEAGWLRETHTAALNLNNFNVDLAQ